MASHYYGTSKGCGNAATKGTPAGGAIGIYVGTSTTSKDIELVLLDGASLTKQDVLNALEMFEQYFNQTGQLDTSELVTA